MLGSQVSKDQLTNGLHVIIKVILTIQGEFTNFLLQEAKTFMINILQVLKINVTDH